LKRKRLVRGDEWEGSLFKKRKLDKVECDGGSTRKKKLLSFGAKIKSEGNERGGEVGGTLKRESFISAGWTVLEAREKLLGKDSAFKKDGGSANKREIYLLDMDALTKPRA